MDKDIERRMEEARDIANGTMELWVVFDSAEEVKQAKSWMKGKRKVKNLLPMTKIQAEKAST